MVLTYSNLAFILFLLIGQWGRLETERHGYLVKLLVTILNNALLRRWRYKLVPDAGSLQLRLIFQGENFTERYSNGSLLIEKQHSVYWYTDKKVSLGIVFSMFV